MNKHTTIILSIFLLCLLALATGCAKKELIKPDETTTTTPAAPVADARPPVLEGGIAGEGAREAVVMEEPAATDTNAFRGETRLETIHFDFDSYLLSAEAREALVRNSRWLQENPSAQVLIEGHTDERGADSYNIALGERRAQSALQYLLTMGVAPARLAVISYGEEKPAKAGHEEDAWSKNRRAEFVIAR